MVRELFYIPYVLAPILLVIFVIRILLHLFVSASEGIKAYISMVRVATVHISRVTSALHEINS